MNENDIRNRTMISDDELKEVSGGDGGACDDMYENFIILGRIGSFDESKGDPIFSVGEQAIYNGRNSSARALILSRYDEKGEFIWKEWEYNIRIIEGPHVNETGDCFEHMLKKL